MHTRVINGAVTALAVFIGSVTVPSAAMAEPAALFKQLAGSWHGLGDLTLEDGTRERLSCKGYYVLKSEGAGLSIATLCDSPTQKFEIRSLVSNGASGLSGQWEERTYNASGKVTGSVKDTTMDLAISGTIEGTISISLTGKTHSVSVTAAGAGIKGVAISLTRG